MFFVFNTKEAQEFLKYKTATKYRDFTVLSTDDVVLYIRGGLLCCAVCLYSSVKPDLFMFALKTYFDCGDTCMLKTPLYE